MKQKFELDPCTIGFTTREACREGPPRSKMVIFWRNLAKGPSSITFMVCGSLHGPWGCPWWHPWEKTFAIKQGPLPTSSFTASNEFHKPWRLCGGPVSLAHLKKPRQATKWPRATRRPPLQLVDPFTAHRGVLQRAPWSNIMENQFSSIVKVPWSPGPYTRLNIIK